MNVTDMVKECVKNSNNSKSFATAVVTLSDGKEYKLRDMCDLGEVKKDLKVLFFGTNGNIYGGYTDGEKDEDEDGQVYFYVKKDPKDIISLSMPEKDFYPDANSSLRVSYGKVKGYFAKDAVYFTHSTSLKGIIEKDNPEWKDLSEELFS